MKNRLLHICNNFSDQKIYVNLVRELSALGYNQVIYNPVKEVGKLEGNRDDTIKNVEYHYAHILSNNILARLRYFKKLSTLMRDIEAKIELSSIGLIHAHFLFSDGGVAYQLKKKYGIKYIVSVRSSDVDIFFKFLFYLRPMGNRILLEAEKIVFINHAHKNVFLERYAERSNKALFQEKIVVIPNAIDSFWHGKKGPIKKLSQPLKLLYVGRIIKRKKLDVVIKAVHGLNGKGVNVKLNVVGDGDFLPYVKRLADSNTTFHGAIYERDILQKLYEDSQIFVMPSVRETFGLVYIEALSQGLPVIFCKRDGIDGFFPEGLVGYAVTPNSIKELEDKIQQISKNLSVMSQSAFEVAADFNWVNVARKYSLLYEYV